MALGLAVADNTDGTGGVATISGAGGGSTVTVYYSTFTGEMTSYSWTSGGSRASNGTVPLAIATGHYLFQVVENTGATLVVGPLVYQSFTDVATTSVWYRILTSVRTRILALGLSGIASSKVEIKWVPRSLETVDPSPPAVLISPFGSETYPEGLTGRDDLNYPVLVVLLDKLQQDATANLNRDTLWRQKVSRAFRSQRLPGVDEVWRCDHNPQPVVDPNLFAKNYLYSPLVLTFRSREPRGLGA